MAVWYGMRYDGKPVVCLDGFQPRLALALPPAPEQVRPFQADEVLVDNIEGYREVTAEWPGHVKGRRVAASIGDFWTIRNLTAGAQLVVLYLWAPEKGDDPTHEPIKPFTQVGRPIADEHFWAKRAYRGHIARQKGDPAFFTAALAMDEVPLPGQWLTLGELCDTWQQALYAAIMVLGGYRRWTEPQ